MLHDVLPQPERSTGAEAAASGALRGGAAGLVYALVLPMVLLAQDATGSNGSVSPSDVGTALAAFAPFLSMFTVTTGAVAGGLLGAACLWPARRLSPGRAAALCGLVVAALGTACFPYVPLGHGPGDVEGFLIVSLLPGGLGGLAAAWHGWALSRRFHPRT